MQKAERIKHTLLHKGHIVDFYEDTIKLPNGKLAQWDLLDHKGASAIVPVDENGNIIMVRQYRNAPDRETLEIPAGGLNPGEDRKTCAIRELKEETGYITEDAIHLLDIYTTWAFCNEVISIYYTTVSKKAAQHLDEDEFVNVEVYPLDTLVSMILNGKIQDAKTISAILAYQAVIQNKNK